ncbi:MAG: YraN family protein [Lewinella sp.]
MNERQKTGQLGESIAKAYLEDKGLSIEAEGYRYKRVELDLIVKNKANCLIFVEVKTRKGLQWGHPSGAVSVTKEKNMSKAAAAYMREVGHDWEVRFDIISILLHKDGTHTLEHIEDAFFPGLF